MMLMIENKKASILLILKVLEDYSDEDHFLTQQDIIEKVKQLYGIDLERKSVAFSISLLQELDYDINKSSRGGYALLSRDFDCTEIQFVTDAIFSSKSISGKQALKLINKLNSSLSKYQRKNYDFVYKSSEVNRSSSNEVFYTLELIEEAKRRAKRISFQYLAFDEKGNKCIKRDGFRYIVSPYYSVNSNGRYYLICNYREKYRPIQAYRIDYMINAKIEEEWPIKPIDSLQELEDFDIAKYLNENIYLLAGEVINAEIELKDESSIQFAIDWFGNNANIHKKDNKILVSIRCNESALFYWCMQYSECTKVISPESLKQRIIQEAQSILEKYK